MKLISVVCIVFVMSSQAAYLIGSKDEGWSPHTLRQTRNTPFLTRRDKQIDQKLTLISKHIDEMEVTSDCSSRGKTNVAKHCKKLWLPGMLLRLAARIALRKNDRHLVRERDKEIFEHHIMISKLIDNMKAITNCSPDKDKKEEEKDGKSTLTAEGKKDIIAKDHDDALGMKDGDKTEGSADGEEKESDGGDAVEGSGDDGSEGAMEGDKEKGSGEEPPDGVDGTGDGDKEEGSGDDTEEESKCDYTHFEESHTMLLPPSGCKIHKTGITEEDKEDILRIHNNLRAKVARGEEAQGNPGPQPPAADMRELVWNNQLAEVTEAWAKQCKQAHDQPGARKICSRNYYVNQNLHFYYGFSPEVDWDHAINDWYIEVKDLPKDVVGAFRPLTPIKIGHYTQVVWGDTTEVGCSIVHYEAELGGKVLPESKIYACNYGKAGNVKERPLYTEGPPASQCPDGPSKKYPDLCA